MFDFTHKTLNFSDRSYSKKATKEEEKKLKQKQNEEKKSTKTKKEVFRTTAHAR